MSKLVIEEYIPNKVYIYDSLNELVVICNNEVELIRVQVKIAESKLEGYYLTWEDEIIYIDSLGNLSRWPKGMYDQSQVEFSKLYKIRSSALKS